MFCFVPGPGKKLKSSQKDVVQAAGKECIKPTEFSGSGTGNWIYLSAVSAVKGVDLGRFLNLPLSCPLQLKTQSLFRS